MALARRSGGQGKAPRTPFISQVRRLSRIVEMPESWVRDHLPELLQMEKRARRHTRARRKLRLVDPPPAPEPEQQEETFDLDTRDLVKTAPSPVSTAQIVESDPPAEERVEEDLPPHIWDLYTRVLAALFFSSGATKVNLSRSELAETLKLFLPHDANIDQVVADTIQHAKDKWRKPPSGKGGMEEREFAREVRHFHREYGAKERFDDAIAVAMRGDRSGDPVDL